MTEPERFVGIDVAKGWLDVVVLPAGTATRVDNDPEGWATLCAQLQGLGPTLIVLEATGKYEVGVVVALDAVGLTPVVANPLATRRFAQSLGRRAKTDRGDALLLARHRQLTKMLVEEKNRRQQADPRLHPGIAGHIAWLEAARTAIDHQLASVVASDPDWQRRVTQLDTVPGIAPFTATAIAVGLPELGRVTAKQVAALAGVAPFAVESGVRRGQRHIGGGRRDVRQALYQAMTTMIRCDAVMGAHYQQLRAAGKAHKQAMIACVRRLLGILTAMIRDGLTWQETEVGQGHILLLAA